MSDNISRYMMGGDGNGNYDSDNVSNVPNSDDK